MIGVDDKSTILVDENIRRFGLADRTITHPARTPCGAAWAEVLLTA